MVLYILSGFDNCLCGTKINFGKEEIFLMRKDSFNPRMFSSVTCSIIAFLISIYRIFNKLNDIQIITECNLPLNLIFNVEANEALIH